MEPDEVLLEAEENMEKSLEHMLKEFSAVRTGKASPALVENLPVEAYGTTMQMKELASITSPEARLLVIQPFDVSNAGPIEKAIRESRLGINPAVDGRIIRLPIPELTGERRQQLSKQVNGIAEETRVAIRSHRGAARDTFKKMHKDKQITDDDLRGLETEVQELTDKYIKKVDEMLEKKIEDITTL
jgi:ribosome recycling factor